LLGADLLVLRYLNNKRLEQKEVSEYQLKLGFKNTLIYKRPLIIDMKTTPHLFVCGLSGSGKSRMIEKAIQGKQVILINVFEEDFKTIQARRINGNGNILKFLNTLLENLYKRDTPIFIVIDELLVLCMDKGITKAIADLLATGRHYNIFVIGISQQGTKESVKFKDLFNSRVCFRQVEESSYRSVLGYSPEDTQLKKRQFYLYSDVIERGYTYSIS
jgi:hypothetical protein